MNLSIFGRTSTRLAAAVFLSILTPALCLAQVKVAAGTITTIAGDNTQGYSGDGGPAPNAELNLPFHAVLSGSSLYIADQVNEVVRMVAGGNGNISTVVGDNLSGYTGDNVKATASDLASPTGVAFDSSGNMYIADTGNNAIRMVTTSTGKITTFAGLESTPGYNGDGSGALSASLLRPSSIVFDSSGNMYIADSGNHVIREVIKSTGVITTYAGDFNTPGYTGDGKLATTAGVGLSTPVAIAMDAAGNLYIADSENNAIRKVTQSTQIITTIAGNGNPGFSGDGGLATSAMLSHPNGVAVDAKGNVYISDTYNQRIRMVTPNGIISTVVGSSSVPGYSGDGGVATNATLNYPRGLSIDSAGNIYIADTGNFVIRQYAPPAAPSGSLPAIGSGGVVTASQFGAFSAVAPGSWIEIYGSNLAAGTANWTLLNGVAPTLLNGTTVTIGGLSAVIDYVSPGQVNAQAPLGLIPGPQQIVVATAAGQSAAYPITIGSLDAGLWAPAMFRVGGKQYVAALLSDGSWALPAGAVPGVATRPANPGETIVMYGVGFGPVIPSTANLPGQTVTAPNSLTTPLNFFFGQTPAGTTLSDMPYDGLVEGLIGLYQFNVVVPNSVAANGALPLSFVLGNSNNLQTLYIAVQ